MAAVHAGNPPDNFFLARRVLRPLQGFTPRFVFDQHDAAPVLLREKFPRSAAREAAHGRGTRDRAAELRRCRAWSCSPTTGTALGPCARGCCEGTPRSCLNGWSLPDVPPDPRWREGADHLLAYVGTISEQDNVDHLVDALAVLRARRPLRMVVAGDGSALAAVKQRARERRCRGIVRVARTRAGARSDRSARSCRGCVRGARDRLRVQPARHVRQDHRVHVGRARP